MKFLWALLEERRKKAGAAAAVSMTGPPNSLVLAERDWQKAEQARSTIGKRGLLRHAPARMHFVPESRSADRRISSVMLGKEALSR
jgi:hypothetical protein